MAADELGPADIMPETGAVDVFVLKQSGRPSIEPMFTFKHVDVDSVTGQRRDVYSECPELYLQARDKTNVIVEHVDAIYGMSRGLTYA